MKNQKSKNIKIFSIISICLIFSILLTGCNLGKKKDALSSDEFSSLMEEQSFSILDSSEQFSSVSELKNSYIAISEDYSYQIEFYEFDSDSDAISMYNENKNNFENLKTNVSGNTETSLSNYSKYTLLTNGNYMIASRIDNTFIYVNADSDYKNDIDNILSQLGY